MDANIASSQNGGTCDPAKKGWVRTGASGQRTNRTVHGFVWTFVGTGGQAGLQLVVLVLLARLLVPADFGLVTAALVVVGFSTIFSQLGIGPALVQRHDLERCHLSTGFTISVVLGALFCGLLWYLAPAVAAFFSLNNFSPVLRVLSFIFPILGLGVVAESLLQRNLRFRCLAVVELAAMVLGYGVLGITLAFLGFGVWSLVAAQLAQAALKTSLLLVVQPHPIYPFLNRKACAELMNFGCGFTMASVGNYIAGQGDNLIIGRYLGATALGVYGRAYQLMAGPAVILGQVLDRVLFPAMSRMQTRPDHLAVTYRRSIALVALMILPTSAILVILAPELIAVLLGREWDHVVLPFQILTVGMIFRASYKISDALVRATGAVYRRAWRQAAYAVLVLAGAWVGQHWGVPGVALGVLATMAINFFLMAHLSLTVASLTWRGFAAAHLPALALTVLLGLGTWSLATLLREGAGADLLVLLLSGGAALLFLSLVSFWPQLFLGRDGRWLLRTLAISRRRSLRQDHPCQTKGEMPSVPATGLSLTEPANSTPTQSQGPAGPLLLIDQLFQRLAAAGIRYCHWKGNYDLDGALAGEGDLDLLVDDKDARKFESVLAQLGFKSALETWGPKLPCISHHYGLDQASGALVHLHVYYRLIVGGKNYHFPLEELFLKNVRTVGGVSVPHPSAELIVFVIRKMLRSTSVVAWLMALRKRKDVGPELQYLLTGDALTRALTLLPYWLPSLDPQLFLQCVDALQKGSRLRRLWLARKLCGALRGYRRCSTWVALCQQVKLLLHGVGLRLRGKRSRKKPASGGAVIAFVGPDASGKSTLVKETAAWLGKTFQVQSAHLGKPPSTWLTFLPNGVGRMLPRIFLKLRGSRPKEVKEDKGPARARPGFLRRLRAVLLAWDRRALARKLCRKAAQGWLVVCDRYPSLIVGAMDSARLAIPSAREGGSRWRNVLAKIENYLYRQIPAPDIVFTLTAPIQVAIERNRQRADSDNEAYLVQRHTSKVQPCFANSRTMKLDTSRPKLETIQTVRRLLWNSLAAAEPGANGTAAAIPLPSPLSGPAALAAPPAVPRSRGTLVEFIGPTGVGKSTLMAAVKETLVSQGYTVWEAHDLILRRFGLDFIRHPKVQSFLVHLLVMPFFLGFLFTKKGLRLFGLASHLIARDGGNYRLCLVRNVMKRIGVHLALQKRDPELGKVDFILCDEGILHNAHNLFVHSQTKPKRTEIMRFADLVPLPDLVIWVTAPPGQSVKCILKRGHARVDTTLAGVWAFVEHAHSSFDTLCSVKKLQGRLFQINNPINGQADPAHTIRERAIDIATFVTQYGSTNQPLCEASKVKLDQTIASHNA